MSSDQTFGPPAQPGTVVSHRRESPTRRRAREEGARRRAGTSASPDVQAMRFLAMWLYVVRESSEYDYMLFAKMIEQTLDPYQHRPAVQQMLALGTRVIEHTPTGDELRRDIGARTIFFPGTSKAMGYLFHIGDQWFLYALVSAAKTALNGDSDWNTVLCGVLREIRPEHIAAGPASRLCRLRELSGQVSLAVKQIRSKIHVFEFPSGLDLNQPGDDATWNALVLAAEFDYKNTLTRLLTGVLFELKNNRFPRPARQLLPGYEFARDGDGVVQQGVVRPSTDPHRIALVRELLTLGATDLPNEEIARLLAKKGLVARGGPRASKGIVVTADEVGNPSKLMTVLWAHLPTYATGKYIFRHECTVPNIDMMHGMEVHRAHPDDKGYFEVELDFGLPEGGWASAELIAEVVRRRLPTLREPSGAAGPRALMKPLAKTTRWTEDGWQYSLSGHEQAAYTLRRRTLVSSVEKGTGRTRGFGHYEGELLGRFTSDVFHRDIAAAIANGLTLGAPSGRYEWRDALGVPTAAFVAAQARLSELDAEAHRLTEDARRARRLASTSEDDVLADEFAREASSARRGAHAVASEAAKLRVTLDATPLGQGLAVDADRFAAALALLAQTKDKAPFILHEILREHLTDLRVYAEPSNPVATFVVGTRFTTQDGEITIGPIEGKTRNAAVGLTNIGRVGGYQERNIALGRAWLFDGVPVDEVMALEGLDARAIRRRAKEGLRDLLPSMQARSALLDCPIAATRRAVLAPLLGEALPAGGHDGVVAEEIFRIYTAPDFYWTHSWVSESTLRKRTILEFIDRYADPEVGLAMNVIKERLGLSDWVLRSMMDETGTYLGGAQNTPPRRPVLQRAPGWLLDAPCSAEDKRLLVKACPWCGQRKLLQPLRVPEITDEVLCVACRRMPSSEYQWPEEYLLPWEGPFGRTGMPKLGVLPRGQYEPIGSRLQPSPRLPTLNPRRRAHKTT